MYTLQDIFNLIQSLNKQEKKFINSYSKKINGLNTNYYTLYKILKNFKNFNESKILRKIEKLNIDSNLSYLQNYLYKYLLETLRLQRKEDDIEGQIKGWIQDARFLSEKKNLASQAEKLFSKASKKSRLYEYLQLESECINRLLFIIYQNDSRNSILTKRNFLQKRQEYVTKQIKCFEKLKVIKNDLFSLYTKGNNRRDKKSFELYSKPIFKDIDSSELSIIKESFKLRRIYLEIQTFQQSLIGNEELTLEYTQDIIHLIKQNLIIVKQNPDIYALWLINYCNSVLKTKKLEEVRLILDNIIALPNLYPNLDNDSFKSYYLLLRKPLECEYYFKTNNLLKTKECLNELEEKLLIHSKQSNFTFYKIAVFLVSFYFQISIYDKAEKWVNSLLSLSLTKVLEEAIFAKIKMIEIVLHYKNENYTIIDSLVQSLERFLKKTNRYHKIEKWFVEIFKNKDIFIQHSRKDYLLLKQAELKKIILDPLEHKELSTFNWLAWINSEINNTSMQMALVKLEKAV